MARLPGITAGQGGLRVKLAYFFTERVLAKLATMTACEYCMDLGSQIARRAGLSDDKLLAMPNYRTSDVFTEQEKLVMDYAVGMCRTPAEVTDELFARMRQEFSDAQIVELTHVIALENMRGRFNRALDISSAGYSDGMVCVRPLPTPAPAPTLAGEHSPAGEQS